jgi:uncharacterized protein (DUF983 family)|tara:strand:- start:712 stop:1011 length:300 start_codon:yes stop_codon:yes gene_type:complete
MADTGFILVAMLGFTALMVWAFFTFSPDYSEKKAVTGFNYAVMGVVGLICVALSFKSFVYLNDTKYEEFLPIFLAMVNLMVIAVGLMVGFLIRNFFIFR